MIDTHAHLNDASIFEAHGHAHLATIRQVGVCGVLVPNIDASTIAEIEAFCDTDPGFLFPMWGLHPCYVKDDFEAQLQEIEAVIFRYEASGKPFYAIGEIGLDMYWDKTRLEQQKEAFQRQISWAIARNLPMSIHSRECTSLALAMLEEPQNKGSRGVLHCFSGTEEDGARAIALGFKLGIGGAVTYKKNTLPEMLAGFGLENLVLETDSPYLAPVPYRGKVNTPMHLSQIAYKLAEVFGKPVQEIKSLTTATAIDIFGLPIAKP